jgi:hypothetical protein
MNFFRKDFWMRMNVVFAIIPVVIAINYYIKLIKLFELVEPELMLGFAIGIAVNVIFILVLPYFKKDPYGYKYFCLLVNSIFFAIMTSIIILILASSDLNLKKYIYIYFFSYYDYKFSQRGYRFACAKIMEI